MKQTRTCLSLIAASALLSLTAWSQGPMTSATPPGWDASLTKLFGEIKAFSAKTDLRILDKSGQETMSLGGMSFALLEEKVRVEVDMSLMKGAQMPPAAVASLKQMGMDRLVSLVVPDKKVVTVIYPGLQATVEMPLPESETAAAMKDAKLETTKLGNETIDGQPCVKNQVVMTDAKGQKREALVWNATNLKDFPVQVRITEGENTIEMRFRQVKFEKPEARQFEPPAGYTKYADFQQFMQAAMQKMMSSGLDTQ
jgi:hypothetical protein